MNVNAPVGVFDSGVGGLTVAREIMRQAPEESLVYFGDTARVPYGSKSRDTILRYVRQIVRFLETKEVKAIVIACNTASAYTLETIEKEVDVPVIGVIKPGAKTAAESTVNGRIGVIATEATISSVLYPKFIRSLNPKLKVFMQSLPPVLSVGGRGTYARFCDGGDRETLSGGFAAEGYRHADPWLYALSAASLHAEPHYGCGSTAGESGL